MVAERKREHRGKACPVWRRSRQTADAAQFADDAFGGDLRGGHRFAEGGTGQRREHLLEYLQALEAREDQEMLALAGTRHFPADAAVADARTPHRCRGRNRVAYGLAGQRKQQERFAVVVFVDDIDVGGGRDLKTREEVIAWRDVVPRVESRLGGASAAV